MLKKGIRDINKAKYLMKQSSEMENQVKELVQSLDRTSGKNTQLMLDEVERMRSGIMELSRTVIKVDKTALKAFIDKVSNLESTKYTEATWATFETELTEANVVYSDENAMQEEVNNVYSELVTAFLNLRLIPDKSLLKELINQANGLNGANYTKAINSLEVITTVDNTPSTLVDNTAKTPVNNGDTTSVKTGDESLSGMFASIVLLSVAGYTVLKRKLK